AKANWDTKDPAFTAETRFAAGQLAESQENFDGALHQYEAALKIDPKHMPSLYRSGVLYSQTKRYPQAIEMWKRYVAANNGSAIACSNLGFCYELAGNPNEAEIAYKKGVAKDPENRSCRVNYGLMLARHGRISEATLQLQSVLTEAEVHYNLASIYEQQGRKEAAKAEYRQAIQLDPSMQDAQMKLSALQ
ncbi:MAG TPA: tetratricopeptide repeat protein, partial [Tepidisphaeraceae bacterium]